MKKIKKMFPLVLGIIEMAHAPLVTPEKCRSLASNSCSSDWIALENELATLRKDSLPLFKLVNNVAAGLCSELLLGDLINALKLENRISLTAENASLKFVVECKNVAIFRALIDAKLTHFAEEKGGNLLHFIANEYATYTDKDCVEIFKIALKSKKFSLNKVDTSNETPIDIIMKSKNRAFAKLILQCGGFLKAEALEALITKCGIDFAEVSAILAASKVFEVKPSQVKLCELAFPKAAEAEVKLKVDPAEAEVKLKVDPAEALAKGETVLATLNSFMADLKRNKQNFDTLLNCCRISIRPEVAAPIEPKAYDDASLTQSELAISFRMKHEKNPLRILVIFGDINECRHLLSRAKHCLSGKLAQEALLTAVLRGRLDVVSLLMPYIQDEYVDEFHGNTILHQIAKSGINTPGQLEAARILINSEKFNINARNKFGFTPIHLTEQTQNPQLKELFRSFINRKL